MATIKNKITNCETISWNELKTYEFNTLKDQSIRDVTKLKNSIVNTGFNSPFYIWNDHRYVIDGTGRHLALLDLEKEGYEIPNLPIVKIKAENKKEALKLVLQVSSQHGQVTQNSLSDFTSIDFEIEELKELQNEELSLLALDTLIENLSPVIEEPEVSLDENSDENETDIRQVIFFCSKDQYIEIKARTQSIKETCSLESETEAILEALSKWKYDL